MLETAWESRWPPIKKKITLDQRCVIRKHSYHGWLIQHQSESYKVNIRTDLHKVADSTSCEVLIQVWSSQRSVNHKLRSIDLSLIFTAWCKAQVAKQLAKDKIYKILSDGTLKTAYRRINHRDMICQTSKPNNSAELIDKQRKKDVTLYIEREQSS